MKRSPLPERRLACRTLVLAGLLAAALPAAAQFKWTGPDGQVHYGDRPPPADTRPAGGRETGVSIIGPGAAAASDAERANAALPYATRAAAGRHPTVLYVSADCPPCASARAHLARRGVPYAERTISTVADLEALKRLGFADAGLPALSVGSSRTQGYEAGAWDRLFDAAGYPRSTPLPPAWKASVEPLSPQPQRADAKPPDPAGGDPARADAAAQSTLEAARRAPRAAAPSPQTNPAGIRF